ncbi:DUF952 domain-containing protein [Oceaniglobus roseus]|uniref:DUF952 domain-containing protein n=1 Tax=Oceaniglobus roseus TaxID=1737570 RepID=UPI000C7F50DA|nr:DUF952 domain-containing protein [Kandeliimicrobium roseum]
MQIYKILRAQEWATLRDLGTSPGAPIDQADGFVHFSTADQVQGTLEKHFADVEDPLVLVAMDADLMGDSLKWEEARGGDKFPHLYRALSLADVIWNREILKGSDGHVLPDGVE